MLRGTSSASGFARGSARTSNVDRHVIGCHTAQSPEGSRIHSLINDLVGNVCRGGPTAQAAQRRCRDDALGSAAHAEQRVHACRCRV
jgi:hypothetical protein